MGTIKTCGICGENRDDGSGCSCPKQSSAAPKWKSKKEETDAITATLLAHFGVPDDRT